MCTGGKALPHSRFTRCSALAAARSIPLIFLAYGGGLLIRDPYRTSQGYLRALGLWVLDESTSQKLKSTTVQEAASIPWIDGGDAGTDRQTESVGVVTVVVSLVSRVVCVCTRLIKPTNQQCTLARGLVTHSDLL